MKIYIIITLIVSSLFSCRDTIKSPEIKGYVYDKETLEPCADIKVSFWVTYQFREPIFQIEGVTDSLGFFDIPIHKEKELAMPFIGGNDRFLCDDCVILLEKDDSEIDSVFLDISRFRYIQNNIIEIDSLFFTARKVEQ